jgi:pimeloyl-ACP methyl ester carboxylesterase
MAISRIILPFYYASLGLPKIKVLGDIMRLLLILSLILMACGPFQKNTSKKPSANGVVIELSENDETAESKDEECDGFKYVLGRKKIHDPTVIYGEIVGNSLNETEQQPTVFYHGRLYDNGKTPIVFFNGGPTSHSHTSFELFEKSIRKDEVSMIFIDQRGTGCSSPYPELDDSSPETVAGSTKEIASWGSRGIVSDAEQIREKLFGKDSKWTIFGQSYGGLIVHRYLEIAPQSIHKAVSHGYASEEAFALLKQRHLKQVALPHVFFAKYPDAARVTKKIMAYLDKGVCFKGEWEVCGRKALDRLFLYLGFRDNWKSLKNNVFDMLEKDDGSIDIQMLTRLVEIVNFSKPPGAYENAAGLVLSYTEIAPRKINPDDVGSCKEIIESLSEKERTAEIFFAECRPNTPQTISSERRDRYEAMNEGLELDPINLEQIRENLTQYEDLTFNLYSGELDPFVPSEVFKTERRELKGLVNYTNFPDSGHEGFHTEDQVWDEMLQ